MLTQERLKELLNYDQETGVFTWQVSNHNSIKAGSIAGTISHGYIRIKILNSSYRAHRLAWLYMTGSWPIDQIDHIDGNKQNNSFINIRQASHSQNQRNKPIQKNNNSGYKGVTWHKRLQKWQAQLRHNKKTYYIGVFKDLELAAEAYKNLAVIMQNEFFKN